MTSRPPLAESLDGARVVVTGATSGLGRAMAEALAAARARVALTSRSRERAEATGRALGPEAVGLELGVRDERSVAALVAEVRERFGGIDMPVNSLDGREQVLFALSLYIADGQIQGIRGIVNPDKLRHLGPVSPVGG